MSGKTAARTCTMGSIVFAAEDNRYCLFQQDIGCLLLVQDGEGENSRRERKERDATVHAFSLLNIAFLWAR